MRRRSRGGRREREIHAWRHGCSQPRQPLEGAHAARCVKQDIGSSSNKTAGIGFSSNPSRELTSISSTRARC